LLTEDFLPQLSFLRRINLKVGRERSILTAFDVFAENYEKVNFDLFFCLRCHVVIELQE